MERLVGAGYDHLRMAFPAKVTANPQTRIRTRTWAVPMLLVLSALMIFMRLHAFSLPLETDECNYAYIGERLLHGDRLYVDVWDHQPPGVFVLFAATQVLFGGEPHVFRWLALGASLASLGLIFAIARLVGGSLAGIGAAALFAICSADPGTAGEGCNREIFMNTLILAAWWVALRSSWVAGKRAAVVTATDGGIGLPVLDAARTTPDQAVAQSTTRDDPDRWERPRAGALVAAGALLAMASALKTIVAVHWVFLAAWVVWRAARVGGRAAVRALALFAAGPLLLWISTFAYFAGTGRWQPFIDAVFGVNLSYSDQPEPFLYRFFRFIQPQRHPFIFDSARYLWWAFAVGVAGMAIRSFRDRTPGARAALALAASGYVALCLPAQFWPHYYYLMIPPATIIAALLLDALGEAARLIAGDWHSRRPWTRYMPLAALCIAVGYTQWRDYLSRSPLEITIKRYNTRDFWGEAQGRRVAVATRPDDSVFVYGNDASIYYYARRRCASRFTMITGLREGYRGAAERRAQLIDDIRKDPPALIVLLFDQPPFPEWQSLLRELYQEEPIGWDFHDQKGEPIMAVLGLKNRTFPQIDWNWDRSMIGRDSL